jgi:hypothetical protein
MGQRITKEELLTMAKSNDASERKRAFVLYQAWVKAAPRLNPLDRLTYPERHTFQEVFKQRGFAVGGAKPATRTVPPIARPPRER